MSLFNELKRRNVFRVGIAYVVLGWLLLQVTDVVVPILELPGWVAKLVLFLLMIGLPLVLFFAWAYELTPEGIKLEKEVERDRSITHQTGRKLDWAIIAVLVVALVWFAWGRYGPGPDEALRDGRQDIAADAERASPVVAVLPFLATGSEDGGFLATGLHDDLLTRLAKLGAFQVVSRTSMMEYADRSKNMRQIGEELGAGYILEGGVQALGNRVRINAQLIHANTDDHVWAETYDRELTAANLFDVQAELAIAIANAMHTTLSPEDRAIVNSVPTQNIDAYSAYLRGLNAWALAGGVGAQQDRDAVAAFELAVDIDPEFALAWAWLAAAYTRSAGNRFDQDASDAALAAIAKARELEPGLLETEVAWAEYLYRQQQEYAQALQTLESLDDRIEGSAYALSLKAYVMRRLGRNTDAYRVIQDVWRLEPRTPGTYFDLIQFAVLNDDCDAAGRHADTLISLAADVSIARGFVAYYELACNGDAERAADVTADEWIYIGDIPISFLSAYAVRDSELAYRVNTNRQLENESADAIWQQLDYALVYSSLASDEAMARQHLDRAGELLEAFRAEHGDENPGEYGNIARYYFALRKDVAKTRHWIGEGRRLVRTLTKNDAYSMVRNRFWNAFCYAIAGLDDEAVRELGELLQDNGGYPFQFVNVLPAFDGLRDHPGYLALMKQYGG
ncbi:MAG: hypothetical protein R3358_05220 [Woeseiaceae bacterium]|nr:hypothetical protein [Woeseiaceae bacterium]